MRRSHIAVAALVAGLILGEEPVTAIPLYVVDSASNLLRVDLATARVDQISSAGAQFTDIAFSATGRLYGLTRDYLYEIDPSTGWSTLIGPHGFGGANNHYGIDSLAFGHNDLLYAAGDNILVSIDPTTAAGTKVGTLSGYRSAGDLALDRDGRLLLTTDSGKLVEVNAAGSGATALGILPYDDIYALATDSDGTLYGVRSTNEVLRIDPATCLVTVLGSLQASGLIGRAWGAAFPAAHMPEPATSLLLALCLPFARFSRHSRSATPHAPGPRCSGQRSR